jgi:hypothetical protein
MGDCAGPSIMRESTLLAMLQQPASNATKGGQGTGAAPVAKPIPL